MADDLFLQQRQAANRVQQMQEHARRVFEAHQGHPPPADTTPLCHSPAKKSNTSLRLEEDQWLILLLALLLFRCGCRTELLLALLYLAL